MNKTYKKAYEIYKKLEWWIGPDPYGFTFFIQGHLNSKFDARFQRDLEDAHKKLFPKKKKINKLSLSEEVVEEIRDKWKQIVQKYVEHKRKQYDLLNKWLTDNADSVILNAEWQIVYSSDFGTYNSQTSPETYTSGNCKRRGMLLDSLGIPYEVRPFWLDENYEKTIDGTGKVEYRYHRYNKESWELQPKGHCLYAPLEPFMLEAIERKNTETLLEWAVKCWRSGTNPKVINPFLPYDILEKSSQIVYGG